MAHQCHLVEIIHASPAKMPVGYRETGGLDDMGGYVHARAKPKYRPGVLGDVGLKKCNLHSVPALRVAREMYG
jgi:hypothetical protein